MPNKIVRNFLFRVLIPIGLGGVLLTGCSTPTSLGFKSSPVSCEHIVRHHPNYSIYVVRINLADPRVSVRVSRGGPDPDGNGPWLTTLLPASEVAARDHYDIAVNGDFFIAKATRDIEGKNTGYVKGKAATPVGTAMTDGRLWHQNTNRPYLEFTATNTAIIVPARSDRPVDPAARQIVGGGQIIVSDDHAIAYHNAFATNRHPRTAGGLSDGGRELTLFVVDGRQPSLSIGMTLAQLSKEMLKLGCDNAINLDGGGSTTLVYRDSATGQLKVLNSPSDGKERSVADVLEIKVNAPLPPPK